MPHAVEEVATPTFDDRSIEAALQDAAPLHTPPSVADETNAEPGLPELPMGTADPPKPLVSPAVPIEEASSAETCRPPSDPCVEQDVEPLLETTRSTTTPVFETCQPAASVHQIPDLPSATTEPPPKPPQATSVAEHPPVCKNDDQLPSRPATPEASTTPVVHSQVLEMQPNGSAAGATPAASPRHLHIPDESTPDKDADDPRTRRDAAVVHHKATSLTAPHASSEVSMTPVVKNHTETTLHRRPEHLHYLG